MRGLGRHLAEQGFTTLGPRLTHHATHPSDLARSRWHDWYLAALDGWHMLRTECRRVAVVGLSVGGATALFLASRQPVSAVVALSSPMQPLGDWRLRLARALSGVYPFLPKSDPGEQPDTDRIYTSYPVWPTNAVVELQDYLRQVDAALPDVTAPALLMHARQDPVAPAVNLDYILGRLGSARKERVWLEGDEHVITDGRQKRLVFDRVTAFLQEQNGRPAGPASG